MKFKKGDILIWKKTDLDEYTYRNIKDWERRFGPGPFICQGCNIKIYKDKRVLILNIPQNDSSISNWHEDYFVEDRVVNFIMSKSYVL